MEALRSFRNFFTPQTPPPTPAKAINRDPSDYEMHVLIDEIVEESAPESEKTGEATTPTNSQRRNVNDFYDHGFEYDCG